MQIERSFLVNNDEILVNNRMILYYVNFRELFYIGVHGINVRHFFI